jgi:hypothetical protein
VQRERHRRQTGHVGDRGERRELEVAEQLLDPAAGCLLPPDPDRREGERRGENDVHLLPERDDAPSVGLEPGNGTSVLGGGRGSCRLDQLAVERREQGEVVDGLEGRSDLPDRDEGEAEIRVLPRRALVDEVVTQLGEQRGRRGKGPGALGIDGCVDRRPGGHGDLQASGCRAHLLGERPLRRRRPPRVPRLVSGHHVEEGGGIEDGA